MKYKNQDNTYTKLRRWRHAHRILVLVLSIIFAAGVIAGLIIYTQTNVEPPKQDGKVQITSYRGGVAAPVDNEFFTFQSRVGWELISDESTPPTKFVYQQTRSGLVERRVSVYLGTVPEFAVTYVVPVHANEDGTLFPEAISPKCSVPVGASQNPLKQVYKGISFTCIPDRAEVIIAAGENGKGYALQTVGRSGKSATFGLLYYDVSSTPEPEIFTELINKFKLK